MATKAEKDAEREEATKRLREILKPGDRVYTVLRKVSSNGMSRQIDVYVIQNNRPRWLTSLVAKACGFRRASGGDGALQVGGAGMDMGFHVVYSLSHTVFRDGFKCTGKDNCPANDHNNDYGRLCREYDAEHGGVPQHPSRSDPDFEEKQRAVETYVHARQTWIAEQRPNLYSRKRKHSDPGYALSQEWL